MRKITVGQKVCHAGFKGVGIVVQILANGTRVAADFPGTNGIIDDACNFIDPKSHHRPKQARLSLLRADYD